MAFTPDPAIVRAAESAVDDPNRSERWREQLAIALDEFRKAVGLANGKIAYRNAHWTAKAIVMERALANYLGIKP